MSTERILDKIKKCLALSKSANEHEAAIALRQARSLMQTHGYSENDILILDVSEMATRSGAGQRPPNWENILASNIANTFGCTLLFGSQAYCHGKWIYVGCGEAAEVASYAFSVLYRQAKQARNTYIQDKLSRCKQATKTRRADLFCIAWVQSVADKVQALSTSDNQKRAIDAYLSKHHSDLGQLTTTNRNRDRVFGERSIRDFAAGHQAGREAYLHRGVTGATQTAPLISKAG